MSWILRCMHLPESAAQSCKGTTHILKLFLFFYFPLWKTGNRKFLSQCSSLLDTKYYKVQQHCTNRCPGSHKPACTLELALFSNSLSHCVLTRRDRRWGLMFDWPYVTFHGHENFTSSNACNNKFKKFSWTDLIIFFWTAGLLIGVKRVLKTWHLCSTQWFLMMFWKLLSPMWKRIHEMHVKLQWTELLQWK